MSKGGEVREGFGFGERSLRGKVGWGFGGWSLSWERVIFGAV